MSTPADLATRWTMAQSQDLLPGQEKDFNKHLVDSLQTLSRQLVDYEAVMQPVQVGFLANALANYLGAEMPSSRRLVFRALWAQVVVFPAALFVLVLVHYLGFFEASVIGLLCWLQGLGCVATWWSGVMRDHQIYDVPYLQGHVMSVRKLIRVLDAAAGVLWGRWRLPDGHDAWELVTEAQHKAAALLQDLEQRENEICTRFRMLPSAVWQDLVGQ